MLPGWKCCSAASGGATPPSPTRRPASCWRPVSYTHLYYAQLEQELLTAINGLGIGPQGFGGRPTCLGLAIEQMPTPVAGLPVGGHLLNGKAQTCLLYTSLRAFQIQIPAVGIQDDSQGHILHGQAADSLTAEVCLLYTSEISCRSATSFNGTYRSAWCSARSIITRSA